ncbi:probable ubiquitin-conjugating enzyme E2 24 isoform X2 [Amaranthus tricolor]|uniref:probable ubiquitin-conjugating enzyme E2 24 isoform X2 n=1 Tax=Amaranthus tricolor TaxID=29722 RepID=UPI00258312F1|nr:probable ubiquitin-conjugating enzyme E2 24 isoform X2 [Amaranthus tricolor]
MAMEFFGDSDIESFSETSSDDQDDIFSIYSGHAQSILSSLEDSIEKIDDFLSFERGFTYGDIVRSATNPSGQMGKVVDLKMCVDLENVFGEGIKDVNSGKLLRMRSILVGDYVIHGPWLGRVEKVVDKVGVVFDDGSKCDIMATDQAEVIPLSPNLLDDSLYPYHPGQRVRVSRPTVSKPARWLRGISNKIKHDGTVVSVEVGCVYIDWLSSAMIGNSLSLPPPTRLQDPKNLTLLSYFSYANWQIGDWCILLSETAFPRRELDSKFDEICSIVKKKIKVDVMWQDGSFSLGLDSHTLFPVGVLNAHDFFPEQFVLEKTSSDDPVTAVYHRWGAVRSVDATEKTVKVKWDSTNGACKEAGEPKIMEETVSAYELVEHPEYSFNIGDIVFMSNTNQFSDQLNKMSIEDSTRSGSEKCDLDLSDLNRCFLSCIGYIIGFKDGEIEVQWASGVMEKVAPYKLLRVKKDDGSVATHFLQENVPEFRDEMTDYEKQSADNQNLSESHSNAAVDSQNGHGSSHFLSLSQAAFGLITSIASNFFKSHASTSLSHPMSCTHAIDETEIGSFDEQNLESCDNFSYFHTPKTRDFDNSNVSSKQDVDKDLANTEPRPATKTKGLRKFKQFDVVDDCSGHHFADSAGNGATSTQMRIGWLKKVQHEWNILEKDLPESIYVRVYEDRIDLLRAAIVGAPGTPYHDGLFFFDIVLPPDYPNVPPLVHYHSGGLRLNPNLYESGRVCLSLLNTWTGTGSEVWNPGSSTILQVLLSLQALVLNEKPYFNEAGYDEQIGKAEGENNSVSYNENAYLGTCKCMLYQLRKPLKHFEELVEEHFERQSTMILSACKAYMEGAPIGFQTNSELEKGNSKGFKIMLAKLFPKLVQAFSEKGINCGQFIEPEN